MEYTPSASKSAQKQYNPQLNFLQPESNSAFLNEDSNGGYIRNEGIVTMDDVLDGQYVQLTNQHSHNPSFSGQSMRSVPGAPPRPQSTGSRAARGGMPLNKFDLGSQHPSQSNSGFNNNNNNNGLLQERNVPQSQSSFKSQSPVRISLTQESLVEKMTEKMKQMAERIASLEAYKDLCEARIKELDPAHQLPVHQSHLGTRPINLQHAEAINKRFDDMQGVLSQSHELKKRLQQAEESLRRETLNNEEQRAYIQILRDSLEVKLTQMGLSFKGATTGGLSIDSNVDGFIQMLTAQR